MAMKPPTNMKGKSPSPNIQRANDTAWNSNQGTTNPQQALNQKATKNPVPVKGSGD